MRAAPLAVLQLWSFAGATAFELCLRGHRADGSPLRLRVISPGKGRRIIPVNDPPKP